MNQAATRALRHLTGEKGLDTVSLDQLNQLVYNHPYFPVGQYLLAKKLAVTESEDSVKQFQKTALYFSNTLWLDYQLTKEKTSSLVFDDEEIKVHQEELAETIHVPAEELVAASELAHQTLGEPALHMEEVIEPIAVAIDEPVVENEPDDKTIEEELTSIIHTDVVTETVEEMAGASTTVDNTTEAFLKEITPNNSLDEKAEEPVEESSGEQVNLSENKKSDPELRPEEPDEHERMFQSIKAMLDASSGEANQDVDNTEVPIDPYYTIDYFASQGIKLDFDPNPQDKLGKNLKKFTQWLRHMKKLGPEDAKEEIEASETEADIQQIADSSNMAKEVVTEAMASVLEKQGKKAKAIELYNKLSFLNPDKSAYFADKIKNLKGF